MRNLIHSAAAVVLASSLLASDRAWGADRVSWVKDFAQAQEKATADRKLILLHFYSENCLPCRKMDETVFTRKEVGAAIDESYIAVKVKVEDAPELRRKYRVQQWPTDVVVNAVGQEVHRSVGMMDAPKYVAALKDVATNAGAALARREPSTKSGRTANEAFPGLPPLLGADQPPQDTQDSGSQDSDVQTEAKAQQDSRASRRPADGAVVANPHMAPSPLTDAENSAREDSRAPASRSASRYGDTDTSTPVVATRDEVEQTAETPRRPATNSHYDVDPAVDAAPPATPPATTERPAVSDRAATKPPSAAKKSPAPSTVQLPPGCPPLGLGGRCPVTLSQDKQWKMGNKKYGAIHRGRTYLFVAAEQQAAFLADPDRYAPALCGYDPVRYAESQELVDGDVNFGVAYEGQIYLFVNEASLQKFNANSRAYAETVYQAMRASDGTTGSKYR